MIAVGREKSRREHRFRIVLLSLVFGPQFARHVGVHVGDEQIELAVAVPVEYFDAHRAPRRGRKDLTPAVLETPGPKVVPNLVVSLHRGHVQVWTPVAVVVERRGFAGPSLVDESGRRGDILEAPTSKIVIENRGLRTLGMQMAGERVAKTDPQAVRAPLFPRVFANVGDEQVEQAVAVVVEKDRTGRMSFGAFYSGLRRDVRELSAAVVPKQDVPLTNGCHEQIGVAVVVDVRERSAHARPVADSNAGTLRDVLETTAAKVAVETVLADLVDEVQIEQPVAVDIRHRDRGAVIVVCRPVILSEIDAVDVLECDSRGADAVRELEAVRNDDRFLGGGLLSEPCRDPFRIPGVSRDVDVCRRAVANHIRQHGVQVFATVLGERVVGAADASRPIDHHDVLAVDNRHLRIGLIAGRQLEPITNQTTHRIAGAGQKHPLRRIGTVRATVVSQHVRPVEVGIDAERDELHIAKRFARRQFLRELRHPVRNHRTGARATRENEAGEPYFSMQLGQFDRLATLVLEDELGQRREDGGRVGR